MGEAGKTALVIGATGNVGRFLLRELLNSSEFIRVGEYGRNVTAAEKLAGLNTGKLQQKRINFERLEEAGLKDGNWDVVFITLGTSRKSAGGAEAFERIDREYVVNAAKAAKLGNNEKSQRLVYLSSIGADTSSMFLYPRSKGLTENALGAIGYSDTIVLRPAALLGAERSDFRPLEFFTLPILGALSHFSSFTAINVSTVARSMSKIGILGSAGLPSVVKPTKAGLPSTPFTLIDNAGLLALAKT